METWAPRKRITTPCPSWSSSSKVPGTLVSWKRNVVVVWNVTEINIFFSSTKWKSSAFVIAGGVRDDNYPESLEKELHNLLPDNPIQQRCKSLNELSKFVASTKLEEVSVWIFALRSFLIRICRHLWSSCGSWPRISSWTINKPSIDTQHWFFTKPYSNINRRIWLSWGSTSSTLSGTMKSMKICR